jgi:hypothetical protein
MDDLKTLQEKRALIAASEDLSAAERSAVLKRIDTRIAELQEERPKAAPQKAKSKPANFPLKPQKAKSKAAKAPTKARGKEVQNMGASTKIIRRYLAMTKKQQPRQRLLNLYTDIKKALLSGTIKQNDPYAKVIMDIQKILVEALNDDFATYLLQMPQGEAMVLADAAKSERELASTVYLRQYLGLVRRPNEARAQKLKERIRLALDKGVIGSTDPNYANIQRALKNLEKRRFELSQSEIAGLQGLAGTEAEEEEANSTGLKAETTAADIQNWNIEGMGFTGHWLELMGDPAKPFQAIVYGRPKGGKTYFNLLLANYLQSNFGRVLYISSEEYGTATLALKLKQLQIHPEITFRGDLPPNVEQYDFVFMDSANRLKIDVEAWETLKKQYPKVSFITVLQATKEGSFRGSQEWTHNCDVIVEVVSGVATAHGRYGQGQMNIFEHV